MNEVKIAATGASETDPILRVSSKTNVKSLAGAITATIKDNGYVVLKGIGDGAIGRGLRASAIASGYLTTMGIELIVKPSFFMTEIGGEERTGLQMLCEER